MATVTGFTSTRMAAIEAASVVSGAVVGDNLILTKHDTTTINAGNVRGATGSPGVSALDLSNAFPVGMIVDYINTTPPTNWLAMTGQTIVGGQTSNAALWAVLPATMKSGANIIFPDTRGRVSVGYSSIDTDFDTIGEIGGAKTHQLTTAELAIHTHVQTAHNHTQNSHAHSGVSDSANVDHTHLVNINTDVSGAHAHSISADINKALVTHQMTTGVGGIATVGSSGPTSGAASVYSIPTGGNIDGIHYHNVSGSTQGHSTNHLHTFSTANQQATNVEATAVNQNAGSGTAHNNMQPYVTFLKIIKAA
jgi:microcystin-dependent protein